MSLSGLGLTPYERKIYRALLSFGKMDAKAISEHSGVPPTAVYPNVKTLVAKELVSQYDAEPKEFEAVEPTVGLKRFRFKQEKILRKETEDSVTELQALYDGQTIPIEGRTPVTVTQGLESSRDFTVSQLETVSKTMYIFDWQFRSKSKRTQFANMFGQLLKRKIDLRIILPVVNENVQFMMDHVPGLRKCIRLYDVNNYSVVIYDDTAAKITLMKGTSNRYNIHIHDPDFSVGLKEFFLLVWDKAKKI
ncbi:MAG: sugar-specific transcriptional regulator TrmB [Candidatus Woesearchaeota archaeon]|jgi:sugar-specific transcriptional regulator TrmB